MSGAVEIFSIVKLFVLAVATLMLGVIVAGMRIPAGSKYQPYKYAKWLTSAAFISLALPAFFWKFFDKIPRVILNVAYSLDSVAYLFLMTVAFIFTAQDNPKGNMKPFFPAAVLLLVSSHLWFCFVNNQTVLPFFSYLFLVLSLISLLVLIVLYCKLFSLNAHKSAVRWAAAYFFAIVIIYSISQLMQPVIKIEFLFLNLFFIVMNIWVVLKMFDLMSQLRVAEQVNTLREDSSSASLENQYVGKVSEQEEELRSSLEKWVSDKKFLEPDGGMEIVASDLGTDLKFLRYYFRTRMPSDFRSWRISLRIEYAKTLLQENPEISMNSLAAMSGFTTRSNFYHYFKLLTGMTPVQFKEKIQS